MRAFVAALLLSAMCLPASGQTLWSRPYQPNQIAVETIVPDAEGTSFFSGATFITGTASLSENIELQAELPVARAHPSGNGASTSTLGNPYVGVGLSSTSLPVLLEVGGRIPAASSNAAAGLGAATDIGRTAAFVPDEFGLSALLNGRYELGRQSTIRFRSGFAYGSRPSPNSGSDSRRTRWQMHYEAQLWRESNPLLTGLSFLGRHRLDSPGTSEHLISLSVMADWPRIQPGLFAGTSLNDLFQNGTFSPLVGLTLNISYGRF
jgi:hypothetical protein